MMKTSYDVENRQIRVFISSTFQDMQSERDYLITKVFPRLQAEAARRDVTIIPLDLRWGVTEEESQTGKVIEICLQEILYSRPFFIGLIGDRYGWCPSLEEFWCNELLQERFGWLKDDIKKGLSVTEIEMQYGVLRSEEPMDAFFYIRQGDVPVAEYTEKLERLKMSVRGNKFGYPVYDYTSVEVLGKQVEEDFIGLLDRLYPEKRLSELEKDRFIQQTFLRDHCRIYIPEESNFQILNDFLRGDYSHFVVTGESGMGKSALIANWLNDLSQDSGYNIIYHFVGNGGQEGSHRHIASRLCNEIRDLYRLPLPSEKQLGEDVFKQLEKLFVFIAKEKPLLIVLDGINQLVNEDRAKQLVWLPVPARNTKILFSTLFDDETMQVFKERNYPLLTLQPLDKERRSRLVNEYLRLYGKKLASVQISRIVDDPQNRNTLVLKTLLNELINFGVHERLDSRIDYYLQANDIPDFFQRVLDRYETDYGASDVRHILALITFSRWGLSEQEIMSITCIIPLHWSQFYCAFRNHLVVKNGVISFSHASIRQACLDRYAEYELAMRQEIVDFFSNKKEYRAYDELPYQYRALKKYENLYCFLVDFEIFDYWNNKDRYELGDYWRILISIDSTRYSLLAYASLSALSNESQALIYNNIAFFVSEIIADYQVALEYHFKALSIHRRILGESHRNTGSSYNNVGFVYSNCGEYGKALGYYLKSLAVLKMVLGDDHLDMATLYTNIGWVYNCRGEYETALEYYFRSLEIRRKILGDNHSDTAVSYNEIGLVYNNKGEYETALKCYSKALKIYEVILGKSFPDTARIYNNIGLVYSNKGEYDTALKHYSKALEIYEFILGKYHPDTARACNNIGAVYSSRGEVDKALEYYFRALEIYTFVLSHNHVDIIRLWNNIGFVYGNCGEYDKALEYYFNALEAGKEAFENSPDIATLYNNIGLLYNSKRDYDKALVYYYKSVECLVEIFGENHLLLGNVYCNIGVAYDNLGSYKQALSYYGRALEVYRSLSYKNEAQIEAIQRYIDGVNHKCRQEKKGFIRKMKELFSQNKK